MDITHRLHVGSSRYAFVKQDFINQDFVHRLEGSSSIDNDDQAMANENEQPDDYPEETDKNDDMEINE